MIRKNFLLLVAAGLTAASALAVPAKPGLRPVEQPDGSVVMAELVGDEHFHYYRTSDDKVMFLDSDGFLKPGVLGEGNLKRPARVAPNVIDRGFPTTGTVKGLIILAEFQDVKFLPATTREYVDKKVNTRDYKGTETFGSVADFFYEQSKGVFNPVFDIVGPITLPRERAYYGVTENLTDFFRDACKAVDDDVDFSNYDVNNDGFVDFVFVIFAGHGQAQGGPEESIWPAMTDVSNYIYEYFDNMNLAQVACSCELRDGEGEKVDGVGTICHEFSHILGLPDIYDAGHMGGYGMSHYDLMDIGTYNDDGRTPAGYTAMDRYTLGWLEPKVLEASEKDVVLRPFIETGDAAFIVNPSNPDEYYILENRQKTGFDSGLPGHGLILSYVHYDPKCWRLNTVNNPVKAGYEHVSLVAADNVRISLPADEAGDPFPGTKNVTSFSRFSKHALAWRTSSNVFAPTVHNIRETEDGNIVFDFDADSSGVDAVADNGATIYGGNGCVIAPEGAEVYDLTGLRVDADRLTPGIYVVRYGAETVKVTVR